MLRIAVCDDVKSERTEVIRLAESYFSSIGEDITVHEYDSGDQLLEDREQSDLYLLDVLMPGKDGISAAGILKDRNPDAVTVLFTSMLESAVDSYRVEASGFLLKPVTEESFRETMDRLIRRGRLGPEASVRILYNHMPMDIPLRKIIVFESELHRVHIRMDGDSYTVSMRLRDLEERMKGNHDFLRCHQSFLVNLRYVSSMEGSFFLLRNDLSTDLKSVPISRNYLKISKKAYYDYRLKERSDGPVIN